MLGTIEEGWAVAPPNTVKVERVDVAVGTVHSFAFKESPEEMGRKVGDWSEGAKAAPGSERNNPISVKKDSLHSILRGS